MSNTRFIFNFISASKPIPFGKFNTLITIKRDKKRNEISTNGNLFCNSIFFSCANKKRLLKVNKILIFSQEIEVNFFKELLSIIIYLLKIDSLVL